MLRFRVLGRLVLALAIAGFGPAWMTRGLTASAPGDGASLTAAVDSGVHAVAVRPHGAARIGLRAESTRGPLASATPAGRALPASDPDSTVARCLETAPIGSSIDRSPASLRGPPSLI